VQSYRYLRVENHEVAPGKNVAVVVINAPPVNSLNERSLDELHTVLSAHGPPRRDRGGGDHRRGQAPSWPAPT
jgi:hypothetical protein